MQYIDAIFNFLLIWLNIKFKNSFEVVFRDFNKHALLDQKI